MRIFDYSALKQQKWDTQVVAYIAAIHEAKGRQELYRKQKPREMEKLVEIAKIQSAETSNAIEGIRTTNTRLKQLLSEKTLPRTRDEEEIAGYRDALNVIHENYEYIPVTPNYILQLHKILYSHSGKSIGGKFKSVQNYINATDENGKEVTVFTPLAPSDTPPAVAAICEQFGLAVAAGDVDPLILIPVFIHDFLCIHPFSDGNGRMSRLLTALLLYRCGFLVGKYVSLEAKIAKTKDLYYDALSAAQAGWHEGKDDPTAFIKYLLGTVVAAYRDLEYRMELVSEKLPAFGMVQKAVRGMVGKFTKAQVLERCPSLSASSVEASLKKLVAGGELAKHGAGRSTFYVRIS